MKYDALVGGSAAHRPDARALPRAAAQQDEGQFPAHARGAGQCARSEPITGTLLGSTRDGVRARHVRVRDITEQHDAERGRDDQSRDRGQQPGRADGDGGDAGGGGRAAGRGARAHRQHPHDRRQSLQVVEGVRAQVEAAGGGEGACRRTAVRDAATRGRQQAGASRAGGTGELRAGDGVLQ